MLGLGLGKLMIVMLLIVTCSSRVDWVYHALHDAHATRFRDAGPLTTLSIHLSIYLEPAASSLMLGLGLELGLGLGLTCRVELGVRVRVRVRARARARGRGAPRPRASYHCAGHGCTRPG